MDTSKPDDADFVEPPGEVWVAETELTPGAVSLTGAIMQTSRTSPPPSRPSSSRRQSSAMPVASAAGVSDRLPHRAGARHVPGPARQAVPVGRRVLHVREPHDRPALRLADGLDVRALLADRGRPDPGVPRPHLRGGVPVQLELDVVPLVDDGDHLPADHHLDRLRRDLHLGAHDRGRRSARVPDRARTRPVGTVRSGPGRLHLQRLLAELRPGEHHRRAPASCSRSCSPCRG